MLEIISYNGFLYLRMDTSMSSKAPQQSRGQGYWLGELPELTHNATQLPTFHLPNYVLLCGG